MASRIPPELLQPILEKSASGCGVREISAWLMSEHNVQASKATVARLIQLEGRARSAAAKTVARTRLATSVISDVDRTSRYLRKAMRIAKTCEDDPEVWVKVSKEIREYIALRAKLSGLDQPDEETAKRPAVVILPAEEA